MPWPFRRKGAPEQRSLENPAVPLSDVEAWNAILGLWHSAAGEPVTDETALSVPAIWSAVNFISSTFATPPLQLFRKTDEGRVMAESDPLYGLLHDAPTPATGEWSSFSWRKYSMTNTLLRGRCYTFIERNRARKPINLWPLNPLCMTVERVQGKKRYRYVDGGEEKIYQPSEIIDVPFMLKADGICHEVPIERLRDCVGLSLAIQRYAAKFFASGGVPPLQLVGPIGSPAGVTRAGIDIMEALKAAKKENRPILPMPNMHELKPIGIDPEKMQMEAARRFQVEESARIFNLPPVFLQDLTHGTFSNTEQQDLMLVKHTMSQWFKAWEQELNLKLFGGGGRVYAEHNVDGLLRGDFKTRIEGLAKGITSAIYTPDEARGFENLPNKPGGDKLYVQGATVPLGSQPPGQVQQPARPAEEGATDGN